MRRLASLILIVAAFVALTTWTYRIELLAQREIYRGLEAVGATGPATGNMWGQIMGRNIASHPPWMRSMVQGAATVAILPWFAAALLLHLRMNTRSGRLRLPHSRRRVIVGIVCAWAVYAITIAVADERFTSTIRDLAFRWGKAAECEYIALGVLMIGPHGPFTGGRWAGVFNAMWMYGPRVSMVLVAFLAALAAFHLLSRWTVRHDGVTRCRACGYELKGLRGATCPECGATTSAPEPNPQAA